MQILKQIFLASIGFLVFLILCLSIASFFINQKPVYKEKHSATIGNTISILLIDGLSKSIFEENLQTGNLPNLQQLIPKSTYVKNGIGSFPSMTGYAFYPFITGEDATKSGIYGLRWFDRKLDKGNLRNYVGRTNTYMNQDINTNPKNIFELSGDQYTCSINSYMNRGVKQSVMTGWKHTTSKYGHKFFFKLLAGIPFFGKRITADFFEHESYTMQLAKNQLQNNPKVQWVTLPSLDAMQHIHGNTPDYVHLLQHIDSLIGDFRQEIINLGQEQTRALAIITDHGVTEVQQNLDLRKNFKEDLELDIIRGKSVHLLSKKLKKKLDSFAGKDAYFVINGNLSAYLYFRNPKKKNLLSGWQEKLFLPQLQSYPTPKGAINILDYLTSIEGIGLIASQETDSTIWVQHKECTARISKNAIGYQYHPIIGDPLTYLQDSIASQLVNNQFHPAQDWLKNTIQTAYPDAIYRLFELMSKPAVGDVIICSEKGYDLAAEYELFVGNYKGGHGDLHKDLLNVPYVLFLPNQTGKEISFARSEELGQWIKAYLFNKENPQPTTSN